MLDIENRLNSKEKLRKWIQQDRVSCGFNAKRSIGGVVKELFAPNYILKFERILRRCEYLNNCKSHSFIGRGFSLLQRLRLRKLQLKLGFSIPLNVCGPGLSIAHYGTLVISPEASIGCNCRIHVGVNIGTSKGSVGAPTIGDNVYIGPGAILFGGITIADGISIGANATVNKSFITPNVVVAGTPAKVVKEYASAWNE